MRPLIKISFDNKSRHLVISAWYESYDLWWPTWRNAPPSYLIRELFSLRAIFSSLHWCPILSRSRLYKNSKLHHFNTSKIGSAREIPILSSTIGSEGMDNTYHSHCKVLLLVPFFSQAIYPLRTRDSSKYSWYNLSGHTFPFQ